MARHVVRPEEHVAETLVGHRANLLGIGRPAAHARRRSRVWSPGSAVAPPGRSSDVPACSRSSPSRRRPPRGQHPDTSCVFWRMKWFGRGLLRVN